MWIKWFQVLFFISFVSFNQISYSQAKESNDAVSQMDIMQKYEDSLVRLADSIRFGVIPMEKVMYNEQFVLTLRKALSEPNSFEYPFDRLKESMHIIYPDDKSFRIFNWIIVPSEFQRRYYGAIQLKSKDLVLYPLYDKSQQLEDSGRALDVLTHKEWYGAEIYNIVKLSVTDPQKRPIYAIFSYNNNSINSKKKIWDHMVITEDGPVFGMPIIKAPQGIINRLIVEYKKEAFVNLNYNKEEKKVIFDRLMSDVGDPTKRFTLIPTGNLDGFEFKNGVWNFVSDAIPVLRLRDGQAPIDGVFPR